MSCGLRNVIFKISELATASTVGLSFFTGVIIFLIAVFMIILAGFPVSCIVCIYGFIGTSRTRGDSVNSSIS